MRARSLLLASIVLGVCVLRAAAAAASSSSLTIASDAFEDGKPIPRKYTCDGADRSPPLHWQGVPEGTTSLALVVDDPDAPSGTWHHWILYNMPPATQALGEGVPATAALGDGSRQGTNDFGKIGYGGPCPPPARPIATGSSSMPSLLRSISSPAPGSTPCSKRSSARKRSPSSS